MHRFYVTKEQINDGNITIMGPDVNHIRNVLRMKPGDEIIICNGQGKDCYCIINEVSETRVTALVSNICDTASELKTKITLYQGLPKLDKMELIIQKAVELGVNEIVPVITKRTVVKLEDKRKEEKKLERWQAISEGAAKQSGRGVIPVVRPVQTYKESVIEASRSGLGLIPYENAADISETRRIIKSLNQYEAVSVFIGPEGGFEEAEIELAKEYKLQPITLGRRILRTETAGLAVLSMMMLELEE